MDKITAMEISLIQNRIYEVRWYKVMLDFDLAVLYGVETKRLNEAVKRNSERFPADFMFRLTVKEWDTIRSQFATASVKKNSKSQIYKVLKNLMAEKAMQKKWEDREQIGFKPNK